MYTNSIHNQPLVQRPRQQRTPDHQLPRGECRFILRDSDPDGSRQRCGCVSFSLNETLPGAVCGCGHQAWHHVSEPTGNCIAREEYVALVDRFKRVEEELVKERKERELTFKNITHMVKRHYQSMAHLRIYVDKVLAEQRIDVDDKIEGALDKAQGAGDDAENLRRKVVEMEEWTMQLEEKIDAGRWQSRSLSPVREDQPSQPELPIRSDTKFPDAWDVRIILVPRRDQQFGFSVDSLAYRRCRSRGLHQDIHLIDRTSNAFTQCVEASFATILRERPWMPLQCLRSSDLSLYQLDTTQRSSKLWDYSFLESQCMAHDKLQGDAIFIALQDEYLSWHDIKAFPAVAASDETCWEHDPELDGKCPVDSQMDFQMAVSPPKLDSASMYEYSPPPYSSRAHTDTHRHPSALEVLAEVSTLAEKHPPSISDRSIHSLQSLGSPESTVAEEDDEHRDKRAKRSALRQRSQTSIPHSSPPAALYYSGRTKKKLPASKAHREPLEFRVSEMKIGNPVRGLLHRHESKEKHTQSSQMSGNPE